MFCELAESILPPEKRDNGQTHLNLNLQSGFRHFLLGVREISKSVVTVLSNKEIREYQQLSRATDYAQDILKKIRQFFRNLRISAARAFDTYNYYIPEVMLTKCIGVYLHETYSHRHFYEYPFLLINDMIKGFQTPSNDEIDNQGSDRKLESSESEIKFIKDVEQNEILDDDMYIFHNTVVSPTPELAVGFENNIDLTESSEQHTKIFQPEYKTWMKCLKIYATETVFRQLEFYFLEKKD